MLRKFVLSVLSLIAMASIATQARADEWVSGYFRSNGAYVQPYYRSSRDGVFSNNWSTYPNINPHTGNVGTHHYPSYNGSSYSPNRSSYPGTRSYSRW